MHVSATEIPEVLRIEPKVFGDDRGYFLELFNQGRYQEHGVPASFVQDNASRSQPGVLRGLHLQHPHGQGKLVTVLEGQVLDVAVDVRVGSPTFGQHVTWRLEGKRKNQLWIPAGFAHGFCVLGDAPATLFYKCTDFYAPGSEMTLRYDDPDIGIPWPISDPVVSDKDRSGSFLRQVEEARLPPWKTL